MLTTALLCAASVLYSANPQTQSAKPAAPKFKLHEIEESIIEWTNYHRARYNLPPLEMDPELMESAREHTNWMTSSGNFVHSRGPYPENIAWGQPDSEAALRSWMNSSGHRANILAGYTKIGVAAYQTEGGSIYWCQQFSR